MYKNFGKIVKSYDTYNRAFEDFLSPLNPLSNVRLARKIIDLATLERYHRVMSYDLQRCHHATNVFSTHVQLICGTACFKAWFMGPNALYSMYNVPIPMGTNMYLDNSNE